MPVASSDGILFNVAEGGGLPTLFAPEDLEKIKALNAANAFSGGVPTDAAGNPDFGAMARTLLQKGSLDNGVKLLEAGINQQGLALAARNAASVGTWGGAPAPAPATVSQPSGGLVRAAPGFDSAVDRTLGFEGGLNKSDTNGTPTNFGINQAAHPNIDVTKLTPDQARGIYKNDYWDAIGADSMSPALSRAAFDTAVIAGPGKAKELVAASGGDPMKLMSLREQFQQDLITQNPAKYGAYAKAWTARNNGLRFDIGALNASQQAGAPTSPGMSASAPPPVNVASEGGAVQGANDAPPSGQHPYASSPPAYKPLFPSAQAGAAAAGGTAPASTDAPPSSMQVAGPGAPSGAPRGAPMPTRPTTPPPLSPAAGAVPQPLDPSFGGQVPKAWLKAGFSAGEWVDYARNQAAQSAMIPGGFGKTNSEQWSKIADGLASSIDKSQTFTVEQKNARDPQALAYERQKVDYANTARIAADNSTAAIRGAGQRAQAEAQGRAEASNANNLVPFMQPDGTMRMMTKAQAIDLASNGVGQGPVKSLPAYITVGQDKLLTKVDDGTKAFQERQVAGERLDALSNLLSTYQTGANSQAFNDAVAKVRSFGIPIRDNDTINPAAVQQFAKNSYANVLSTMKEQGNRQYAAEVSSAVNSNPNTDLQPEANAAMIAQMQGIKAYHDQNHRDFTDWYGKNQGASNDAQFQIGWAKDHPVQPFVDSARKEIAPLGMALPAKAQLVDGQAYMVRGVKARWSAAAGGFVPVGGR